MAPSTRPSRTTSSVPRPPGAAQDAAASLEDAPRDERGLPVVAAVDALRVIPTRQTTPNTARVSDHRGVVVVPGSGRIPSRRRRRGGPPTQAALQTRHTLTDFYCGAGGSSLGAHRAGVRVEIASNHWPVAAALHATGSLGDGTAGLPGVVLVSSAADAAATAWLGSTLMWSSPPCPPYSAARTKGKASMSDTRTAKQKADDLARARGSMWTPLQWVALHRDTLEAAVTENVVELFSWDELPAWLDAWTDLGFRTDFVCLNSLFVPDVDGRRVPQSRDRVFFVHTRNDLPTVDLAFTARGVCRGCGRTVDAIQTYKETGGWVLGPEFGPLAGRRYGKYNAQYIYTCPDTACAQRVDPFTAAVADRLDLSDRGTAVADRRLSAALKARIQLGLDAQRAVAEAVVATGADPGVLSPMLIDQSRAKDVTLSKVRRVDTEYGPTLTGRQVLGVAFPPADHPADVAVSAEDCSFRMLTPAELWPLGGFPADFDAALAQAKGITKRDRALAVGNAVTPAVAAALFSRITAALPAQAPSSAPGRRGGRRR